MAHLLVLTESEVSHTLPGLTMLPHHVQALAPTPANLVQAPPADVVLVDARAELSGAKSLCQALRSAGLTSPLILVTVEGSMNVVDASWDVDDVLLTSATPVEIDMRVRLAEQRRDRGHRVSRSASGLTIDDDSYTARIDGNVLNLTFKEFELLRYLAAHPARVFTREQLLSDVWGYDYFGGTRTVDVHIRRLRAKLGELEHVIGTVRNVGYRFEVEAQTPDARPAPAEVS